MNVKRLTLTCVLLVTVTSFLMFKCNLGEVKGSSTPYGAALCDRYKHDHIRVSTLFNCIPASNTTAVVAGKSWIGDMFDDEDCDIKVYPNSTNHASGYILGGRPHALDDKLPPRYYIPSGSNPNEPAPDPPGGFLPYNHTGSWGITADDLPSDEWIINQTINVVNNTDPHFMYILLANMDEAGHLYGSFLDSGPDLNNFTNYHAMIDQLYLTDYQVGRFIDHLNSTNKLSDSIIVVTADHGMSTMKNASKTVDIRKILKNYGIYMKANDRSYTGSYNSSGQYDWILSEGPVSYIYNVNPGSINTIKSVLSSEPSVWKVLNKSDQETGVNPETGRPYNLYHADFQDVIWPDLIVLLNQNYMTPIYYDAMVVGANALRLDFNLPEPGPGVDVLTIPGAHGTYSEQYVPLIFYGKDIAWAPSNNTQVSTLDIMPTICKLNNWTRPSSAQGTALSVSTSIPVNAQRIYIIAIDGMRGNYYNYTYTGTNPYNGLLTPNLTWLGTHGKVFTNCTDVLVAFTGTNHIGIITSTYAGTSGILGVGGYYQGLYLPVEGVEGVGGILIPIDKFGLLAPYIGLASTILVATVATAIYVKHVKRRKEKQ